MSTEFMTGVGRIVWGNPARVQIKKYQDGALKGQPVIRDGKPVEQWVFGVAFPKNDFSANIWPFMEREARSGYPQGVPPRFSWKYIDGDSVDSKGQPYSQREGYAGCYVLTISTEAFAPPIYKFVNGAYVQLKPEEIKTGDYVVISINCKVNVATGTNTPSLYINPVAIEHVGYGTEIRNSPDPQQLFGGRSHALPAGASATPIASSSSVAMPGTMPGQPMPGQPYTPPGAPMPGYQAPQGQPYTPPGAPTSAPTMPGMMPPPAPDFIHNAGGMPGQPYTPPGAPMPGQPMPGQPMPGQPMPGQPMPGQPMPGMMPPR